MLTVIHNINFVAIRRFSHLLCLRWWVGGGAPLGSAFLCSSHKHAPKWGRGDEWEWPGSHPGAALLPNCTRTCTHVVWQHNLNVRTYQVSVVYIDEVVLGSQDCSTNILSL